MKKKLFHFNNADKGGGAEMFALDFLSLTAFESVLCVKKKYTTSEKVIQLRRSWISYGVEFIDKLLFKLFKRKLFANFSVLYSFHRTWKNLQEIPFFQEADAVIIHNIHDDFFDLQALECIAETKPIYWILHDMWVMTGGEAYVFDHEGYKIGNAKTPYAQYYPLCRPIIDRRQQYLARKKQLWKKLAHRITFIPVSYWLEDCLKKAYVYHPAMKIRTIQNGVDTTVFFDQQRRTWNKIRLLVFNTNNPFKGTTLLNKVLPQLDTSHLDLYVIGEKLSTIPHQYVWERTYDRNTLNNYYNQVDVLIFPSRAENFPLTTLEAMATGVCVVASRVGGIVEQINEENGFLFENGSEDDLYRVLQEIISLPLEQIRAKGGRAKASVNSKFTKENMEKLYKRLLDDF